MTIPGAEMKLVVVNERLPPDIAICLETPDLFAVHVQTVQLVVTGAEVYAFVVETGRTRILAGLETPDLFSIKTKAIKMTTINRLI
jgi:hypothetical protein